MPAPPTPSLTALTVLTVRPWPDPVLDQVGHDPRSTYVERFWLGVLGPTATWLLRRLVGGLDHDPAGFELDLAVTAAELGLGSRSGPGSPFVRALGRCCRFNLAELTEPTTLRVRRKVPPLTKLQLARLVPAVQEAHQAWVDDAAAAGVTVEAMRMRARRLALSLVELGEDGERTERQLHRWGIHPAMAHDATAWAVAQHRAAHHAATGEASAG